MSAIGILLVVHWWTWRWWSLGWDWAYDAPQCSACLRYGHVAADCPHPLWGPSH